MLDHFDFSRLPAYPDYVTPPASPAETKEALHALVEALTDEAADALCRVMTWWAWPPGVLERCLRPGSGKGVG